MRIPFINEKYNHVNNGHLGINRTISKIKETVYFWETIIEDVKSYLDKFPYCIISKKGKNINTQNKIIITKGSLDRIVEDGWQLDDELNSITGYCWIIDIINHFSKYLMSIPVKNNNAENLPFCIKQYVGYVSNPKIFQSDNVSI